MSLDQYITHCEGRIRKARVLLADGDYAARPTFEAMLRDRIAHYTAEIQAARRMMARGGVS